LSVVTTLSRLQVNITKIAHRLFYISLLWKMVDRSSKSILDIGCGKGSSIVRQMRTKVKGQYIVGCDIFSNYVKKSKQAELYDERVVADARHLPFIPRSFELVFCLEVIEHLAKPDGEKLLSSLECISSKEVALSTPVGFMFQGQSDEDPYQTHESAWFPVDFKKRNYRVIGVVGPFFLRGRHHYASSDKYFLSLAQIGNLLLQPFFQIIPYIAFQMICVKKSGGV
jgi:SAM-dependent methyltransferase